MKKTIITKISAWGNGYGLRLPKMFMKETLIKPNNILEVSFDKETMTVERKKSKEPLSVEYFRNALKKAKKCPDDMGEMDWGKPVGKEIW